MDQVLVAAGRTANTAGLGLEALGVKLGKRGQVEVDDHVPDGRARTSTRWAT